MCESGYRESKGCLAATGAAIRTRILIESRKLTFPSPASLEKENRGPKKKNRPMRRYAGPLALLVLFPLFALAGDINEVVPEVTWLAEVLSFIQQYKAFSGLALAAMLTQLVMRGFQTSLAGFAGRFRLLVVAVLNLASAVMASMVSGQSVLEALATGVGAAALQVFIHQLYVQFGKKQSEKPVHPIGPSK